MHKGQPLDYIRRYFGVRVAMYYAWLGFYNMMLVPAMIIGILCILFGIIALHWNTPA